MDISQSYIAISGAASGIGRHLAEELAKLGAHVILLDVNKQAIQQVCEGIQCAGNRASWFDVDVTNEQSVVACFESIAGSFSQLNALINCAGIISDALLLKCHDQEIVSEMSFDQFSRVMNVNVNGTFLCGKEAARWMLTRHTKGVIINVSSVSRAGNFGQTNYSASKAAVAAMTVVWSKEFAKHGIRCAGIAPGLINTQLVQAMSPDAQKTFLKTVPAGRFGTLDEIAESVQFILSNEFFNGRILEIDGGKRV